MKSITSATILTLLLSVCILSSCGSTTTEALQPASVTYSNPFFPLEVGNYWVYSLRSNPSDSVMKRIVVDSISLGGNTYFTVVDIYYAFRKGQPPDTLYLRYRTNEVLAFYYKIYHVPNGTDSAYIDFGTISRNSSRPYYPGLVSEYPASDSTILGRFDSCKVVTFDAGLSDPIYYFEYVSGIGAVAMRILYGECCLMRAKIGNTLYPH